MVRRDGFTSLTREVKQNKFVNKFVKNLKEGIKKPSGFTFK